MFFVAFEHHIFSHFPCIQALFRQLQHLAESPREEIQLREKLIMKKGNFNDKVEENIKARVLASGKTRGQTPKNQPYKGYVSAKELGTILDLESP